MHFGPSLGFLDQNFQSLRSLNDLIFLPLVLLFSCLIYEWKQFFTTLKLLQRLWTIVSNVYWRPEKTKNIHGSHFTVSLDLILVGISAKLTKANRASNWNSQHSNCWAQIHCVNTGGRPVIFGEGLRLSVESSEYEKAKSTIYCFKQQNLKGSSHH